MIWVEVLFAVVELWIKSTCSFLLGEDPTMETIPSDRQSQRLPKIPPPLDLFWNSDSYSFLDIFKF